MLGTRPEAIKQAPVLWALNARPTEFEAVVVNTGQHRELLEPTLGLLGIEPHVSLDVLRPNQGLSGLNARCLAAMDEVLEERRPAAVLVQGDTTTAMAAATAAFYRKVPVGHVEAGLRSGSLTEPFPEEANRIWIDAIARWRWAPTEGSANFLRNEGLGGEGMSVTGNTVVDALKVLRERVEREKRPVPGVPESSLERGRTMVLVTCHRRESFGDGVQSILRAIQRLATRYPEASFVYPVHMNPNVRAPTFEALGGLANVHLIDPLPYDGMVRLMSHARLVLTDSGGIQEEAPSFGVPALVLRNRTERPEGVAAGCVQLVGTDEQRIVSTASRLLDDPIEYARMSHVANPYGDGCAAERIVDILARDLNVRSVQAA